MNKDTVKHILMLEDMENDVELIKRAVKKNIPNAIFSVAMNKQEFLEKIEWQVPQIILSDYNIPGYNGLDAMFYVNKHFPHIPFIFVTGTLQDEEKVAQAVLSGADGYVLKDNLKSLSGVIEEVLAKSEVRYQAAEEALQRIRQTNLKIQKITSLLDNLEIPEKEKQILKGLIKELEEEVKPETVLA